SSCGTSTFSATVQRIRRIMANGARSRWESRVLLQRRHYRFITGPGMSMDGTKPARSLESQFAEAVLAAGAYEGCAAKLSFLTNSRLNNSRLMMACSVTVATDRYQTWRMVKPG